MKKHTLIPGFLALVIALAFPGCATSPVGIPVIEPTQTLAVPAELRDVRYGEVIPVFKDGFRLYGEVYNTMSLNDCPANLWAGLDAKALAKAYGAAAVKLNGPRYWVMDRIVSGGSTLTGTYADFGGIQMKLLARVAIDPKQVSSGKAFYLSSKVQRTTTYTYMAGKEVYELVSPTGEVWRMQSYSQTIDPRLSIGDLDTLGSRLKPPSGWKYRTRVLETESVLRVEGLAWVLQDDFENSYQKVIEK
jgi:hypothetical protein